MKNKLSISDNHVDQKKITLLKQKSSFLEEAFYRIFYDQLHIQSCILCMVFDKLPAWGNIVAHQHTENPVCFNDAVNGYLFQCPCGRIHGCFPKLLTVHFSQTFVPLNMNSIFFS